MTMKRMIDISIRLLLIMAFITTMSACDTVDTSDLESSEVISEQGSVSSTEQANSSTVSEVPSSQTDLSISFQANSIKTEELDVFGYWLYTPKNPTENMPLIVYLHGASGRGEDLSLVVADEDFPKYLQSGELGDVRAYVLIPQLPADLRSWSDISDSLYSLIQKTVLDLSIDTENISLAGFSMGGTAVWELAVEYPNLFARIAPLAGSAKGVLEQVSMLQEIPVRAFVGADDTVIAPNSSEQMVEELKKAGADAQIIVLDGADHVLLPSLVYHDQNNRLVDWLVGIDES